MVLDIIFYILLPVFSNPCLYEYPWGRPHAKKRQDYRNVFTYLKFSPIASNRRRQRPRQSSLAWIGDGIVSSERMAKADKTPVQFL